MGNTLLLRKADFSGSAISAENLYDLVKKTDNPSLDYPLSTQEWYNNIALGKNVRVYAIEFTLPSDLSNFDKSKSSVVRIGAYDGSSVVRYVDIDLSEIVAKAKDGIISGGTKIVATLPSVLSINAGEYVYIRVGAESSAGNTNKMICYARTPSGDYGYMAVLGQSLTSYNFAINLYGE